MRYIRQYKMFESSEDIFPGYHPLKGMNINRVLEDIYAILPQEEIYKKILKNGDEGYSTWVDIDTDDGIKRVLLEVSSSKEYNLSCRVIIDNYEVGMKRIEYKLFRKLKLLYNDLFKTQSS